MKRLVTVITLTILLIGLILLGLNDTKLPLLIPVSIVLSQLLDNLMQVIPRQVLQLRLQ